MEILYDLVQYEKEYFQKFYLFCVNPNMYSTLHENI